MIILSKLVILAFFVFVLCVVLYVPYVLGYKKGLGKGKEQILTENIYRDNAQGKHEKRKFAEIQSLVIYS